VPGQRGHFSDADPDEDRLDSVSKKGDRHLATFEILRFSCHATEPVPVFRQPVNPEVCHAVHAAMPRHDPLRTPAASITRYGSVYRYTKEELPVAISASFRVYLKVIRRPFISITNMVTFMTDVYTAHGIQPIVAGRDDLDLPDLQILDVGSCSDAAPVTSEQQRLYAERAGAAANDIIAYFVEQTIPPLNGCARFPDGRPGVA
jgi:hypothetical protein